jgi:hypothetical protein
LSVSTIWEAVDDAISTAFATTITSRS